MRQALARRPLTLAIILIALGFVLINYLSPTSAQSKECAPDIASSVGDKWQTNFCDSRVDFAEFLVGQVKDGIPALINPKMESIEFAQRWLGDNAPVILVEIEGEARAYPLAILMWHEIANDEIVGVPIAVTFCPLCNSSIAYDRRLDDTVLIFGVSGLLRNSDMVMFDYETESWWQQLTGEALVGDYAGKLLDIVPSLVIDFASFAREYPDGLVMSRETDYQRQYGMNPYEAYDSLEGQPFLFDGELDDRLRSTENVLATLIEDIPKAYPFAILRENKLVNDIIGETPIVIFYQAGAASALDGAVIDESRDLGTAALYSRLLDGQTLQFKLSDEGAIVDEATGSQWDVFGKAINGELAGKQLIRLNAFPHFWFAWAAFYPETEVYE